MLKGCGKSAVPFDGFARQQQHQFAFWGRACGIEPTLDGGCIHRQIGVELADFFGSLDAFAVQA